MNEWTNKIQEKNEMFTWQRSLLLYSHIFLKAWGSFWILKFIIIDFCIFISVRDIRGGQVQKVQISSHLKNISSILQNSKDIDHLFTNHSPLLTQSYTDQQKHPASLLVAMLLIVSFWQEILIGRHVDLKKFEIIK